MVHQVGMLVAKRGIDQIDIPSPTNFPPEGFRHGATLRSEPRTTRLRYCCTGVTHKPARPWISNARSQDRSFPSTAGTHGKLPRSCSLRDATAVLRHTTQLCWFSVPSLEILSVWSRSRSAHG